MPGDISPASAQVTLRGPGAQNRSMQIDLNMCSQEDKFSPA